MPYHQGLLPPRRQPDDLGGLLDPNIVKRGLGSGGGLLGVTPQKRPWSVENILRRTPGVLRRMGLNIPDMGMVSRLLAETLPGAGMRDSLIMGQDMSRRFDARDYVGATGAGLSAAALGASELLPGVMGATARKAIKAARMDEASRMARARDMGFDTDTPLYHGTNQEKFTEFKDELLGFSHDGGHYGRGHYFAGTPGEARYYGRNVDEYVTNAKLLDLSNETGDYTYRGHFKSFAPKLDKIGALDGYQKKALTAIQDAEKYIDDNIEYLAAQSRDGSDGWMVRIKNPASNNPDDIITSRIGHYGEFAKTKEDALNSARNEFMDVMERHYPDQFPGLGTETASLSDYVRADSTIGPEGLSEAEKRAGYDGIRYGDETVIFYPKNIRSTKAKFDPKMKESANILAGAAGAGLLGLGLSGNDEGLVY